MHKKYSFKYFLLLFVFVLNLISIRNAFGQISNPYKSNRQVKTHKLKWQINAIDNAVFVENKGQFDKEVNSKDIVLYEASLGNAKAYFTSKGVIYKYVKPNKGTSKTERKYVAEYTSL